jgi:hypothetical protein
VRGISFSAVDRGWGSPFEPVVFPERMFFDQLQQNWELDWRGAIGKTSDSIKYWESSIRDGEKKVAELDATIKEKMELANRSTTSPDARELLLREVDVLNKRRTELTNSMDDAKVKVTQLQETKQGQEQKLAELPTVLKAIEDKVSSNEEYLLTTDNNEFRQVYKFGIFPKLKLLLEADYIANRSYNNTECTFMISVPNGYWKRLSIEAYFNSMKPEDIADALQSQLPRSTHTISPNDHSSYNRTIMFTHESAKDAFWDLTPGAYGQGTPVKASVTFKWPCNMLEMPKDGKFKLMNLPLPYSN